MAKVARKTLFLKLLTKKLFVVCVLLVIKGNVFGQNHLLGIKGGISWTNVASKNFPFSPYHLMGTSAGVTYDYLFKKYFSAGADFMYEQRGFTHDINLTDEWGNPTGKRYKVRFNYDYLSFPVKIGFYLGKKFHGFANIGLVPAFLIDAKIVEPILDVDGNMTGSASHDIGNIVSRFDLAAFEEIGAGYIFKNRFWLFGSFKYQHSFITITNSEYASGSRLFHNGMTLSIGLKYALKKE